MGDDFLFISAVKSCCCCWLTLIDMLPLLATRHPDVVLLRFYQEHDYSTTVRP